MNQSALRLDAIINRQAEAVIVICTNHIRAAVHLIAVRHIAINHPAVILKVVQAVPVQVAVTIINQI